MYEPNDNDATPAVGIIKLNDNCLERIFKFLKLQNQLRFAQSHYRLERVFMETIIKKMPTHFTIELYEEIKEYSEDEILEFWCCYGACLESIDEKALIWNQLDFSTTMYNTMHKYCKNLKHLEGNIPVSNTSIFSLNDDCIERIFELLNLQEQIRLACSHSQLARVFNECIVKKMPTNFTYELYEEIKEYTAGEILFFWKCYAPCLRSIDRRTQISTRFDFRTAMTNTMRIYCVWPEDDSPPSNATIVSLSDNHIEKILNLLHLQQQLRFAHCHWKFERVLKERICPNWSTYFTNELYEAIRTFSDDEIEVLWRCYGVRLKSIDVKALLWNQLDFTTPMYNAMHRYCPYIKLLEASVPISSATIFDLNDDCFIEIFSLLTLQEQVCLAQSHSQLERAFTEYIYQKIPPQFNGTLEEGMRELTDDEMQTFWQCYGPYVQSFDMKTLSYKKFDFSITTYEIMRTYCTNLQRLEFSHRPLAEFGRFINISNMQTITEVDISRCNIVDYMLQPLRDLPNLVALGLSYNWRLKGRPILALRQLKRLSLFNCIEVTMQTLHDICKTIKLRYLDIRQVKFHNLNAIVEHCQELEELRFSVIIEESLYENIGLMPKLKSLTVVRTEPIRVSFFYILADYHGHDLEEFKITRPLTFDRTPIVMNVLGLRRLRKLRTFWMYNFTFKPNSYFGFFEIEEMNLAHSKQLEQCDYLNIIKSFTKLKRLCTYGCVSLQHTLILDVISVLESRAKASATPKPPLHWLVRDERSKSKEDIYLTFGKNLKRAYEKARAKQKEVEDNPVYIQARHLLRLMYVMRVVPFNEGSIFEVPVFPAECYKNDS